MKLTDIQIKLLVDTAQRLEDIPDSDYFGTKFKDFVSNSLLKLINPDEGGSPQRFLDGFQSKESPALELGSAVHQMILEKEKYFLSEVEKPTGKIGPIIDTAYRIAQTDSGHIMDLKDVVKEACMLNDYYPNGLTDKRIDAVIEKGQEYYDFLINRDSDPSIIVLTPSMRERLTMCMESVKNNKQFKALLTPDTDVFNVKSFNEDVVTMDAVATIPGEYGDEEVLVPMKCKIDNWSIDFDNKVITLNDLKTTSNPIQTFPGRMVKQVTSLNADTELKFQPGSFQKYHYQRQMAMYAAMLLGHCKKEYGVDDSWTMEVNMLVVETLKPHHTQVFKVSEKWLEYGYSEWIELLQRLVFHRRFGFDVILELPAESTYEI